MELRWWHIQFVITLMGTWLVPKLWVVYREWPFHFLCSAVVGSLAFWAITFTCRRLLRAYGISNSRVLVIFSGMLSVFVSLSLALLAHYGLDYSGQEFIPAVIESMIIK